jgi:uncharacterized protein
MSRPLSSASLLLQGGGSGAESVGMESFRLESIPAALQWLKPPSAWSLQEHGGLEIISGERTDLFINPADGSVSAAAAAALFVPPPVSFLLAAKVTVGFAATFDAGVLLLYARENLWAKLCFELSPQRAPTVVSVVTRGESDDCNSTAIDGQSVWLRIAQNGRSTAFHYSLDGSLWHLVRFFSLGVSEGLRAGFCSQSPTGKGCRAVFSAIRCEKRTLGDLRSGE